MASAYIISETTVQTRSRAHLALSSKRQIRYWFSKLTFQKILVPGEYPHDVQPFIIVPLESKLSNFAFVKRIRKLETTAIMKADEVIIIGWSLPETDKDQENIIRSAIAKRSKPIARLTVISRSSPPEHFSRFSKIFDLPKKNVRVFNAGFESFVDGPWMTSRKGGGFNRPLRRSFSVLSGSDTKASARRFASSILPRMSASGEVEPRSRSS